MRASTALVLALALSSACGGKQDDGAVTYTEAAAVAFADAERAFDRKDYELARARFTDVYNQFPYSQYASLAEFRIGDAFLRERSYPRAIESFRRFVRIHPTHELVPEAQYKIALAYVQQMPRDWFLRPPSHERDLTETENAHRALELFLAEYPSSEFAEDARGHLTRTVDRLASHELYVAEFYTRQDSPRAAALRCHTLIERYPTAAQVPNALFLLGRSLIDLGDVDAAVETLHRLTSAFPDHPLSDEAAAWLARYGE